MSAVGQSGQQPRQQQPQQQPRQQQPQQQPRQQQPQQHGGNRWHLLDSFASSLLSDDNAHSSELPVYHTFQPRRSWFLGLRRAFAVVSLITMVAWLVLDVSLAQMNALVPGLKDTLQFESVQFTDPDEFSGSSYAELIRTGQQPGRPGSRVTCSCAFNNKSVQVPPSFSTDPRPRNTTDSPLLPSIEYCIKGSVASDMDWLYALDNSSSAANASVLNETYNMMDEFLSTAFTPILNKVYYALYYSAVWNPKTPAVLSQEAWRVAMGAEAYRQARSSYDTARAELLSEAVFAMQLSRDVRWRFQKLGTHYMDALLASYTMMVARLWGVEADMAGMASIDSLDPTMGKNGTSVRVTCTKLPSTADLPFELAVYCARTGLGDQPEPLCPSLDDAYYAYINWCAPSDCVLVSAKTTYFKLMQNLAAIGGIYSIFTLFLFSVLWKAACSIERRVPSGWLCMCRPVCSWLERSSVGLRLTCDKVTA